MEELIRRQDAIDAVAKAYRYESDRITALQEVPIIKNNDWIPCSEKYPKNEEEVEITFIRKHKNTGELLYLTARAFYEDGTLNTEDSFFYWEDMYHWKYDEERDGYVIPEGWWEYVMFSESFDAVDDQVIAWRPLPEPYKPCSLN